MPGLHDRERAVVEPCEAWSSCVSPCGSEARAFRCGLKRHATQTALTAGRSQDAVRAWIRGMILIFGDPKFELDRYTPKMIPSPARRQYRNGARLRARERRIAAQASLFWTHRGALFWTYGCARPPKSTHRGARAHDHKVKSIALCRLSYAGGAYFGRTDESGA